MKVINKNLYFYRHKWCLPVKGLKRGSINDFDRGNIKLVPNLLCDILLDYSGCKISMVYEHFVKRKDDENVLNEYFQFLIDEEFIFLSEDIEYELDLNLQSNFEYPHEIHSCIIDYNKNSFYSIESVINQVNNLGGQSIQFRFFDTFSNEFINRILECTNNTTFRNIELILKYLDEDWEKILKENIEENYRRVSQVVFHSYKENVEKENVNNYGNLNYIYSTSFINDCSSCGTINPIFFDTNKYTYLIGKKFNTCLYKKISVDVNGNIKNCPSMNISFGNIQEVKLKDVVIQRELKKYWNITKREIDDCKKCEFRLVCTDCRAYLKNDDLYSKPLKCNYDIYSSKWTDF